MYIGRFAPSPTGPLHFGSLIAALASYLEARRHDGRWIIRIEDVDTERSRPGACEEILSTLAALGLQSDEPVIYQSNRTELYHRELERIRSHIFECSCSRKEIGIAGESRYPGTCRAGATPGKPLRVQRVYVNSETICFEDQLQGRHCSNLEAELGDFPLLRLDSGIFSYQLAVVVDDELQGITHVVRGADLLDSTPRQIYLQRLLGYRSLHYMHVPVATGPDGEKLSKQTLAPAIDPEQAGELLIRALQFLGQNTPESLCHAKTESILEWANANWSAEKIPALLQRPAL